MNGTEKQVAWAREIVAAVEAQVEAQLTARLAGLLSKVPAFLQDTMRPRFAAEVQTMREAAAAFIAAHDEAAWWIDQHQRRAVGNDGGEWIAESIAKSIIEQAAR